MGHKKKKGGGGGGREEAKFTASILKQDDTKGPEDCFMIDSVGSVGLLQTSCCSSDFSIFCSQCFGLLTIYWWSSFLERAA